MGSHASELLNLKSSPRQAALPEEPRQKSWEDTGIRDKLHFRKLTAIHNHNGVHADLQFQFLVKMLGIGGSSV